jgi:SpoVK/Ycf46/Vps4 family AAA+-type ATPase
VGGMCVDAGGAFTVVHGSRLSPDFVHGGSCSLFSSSSISLLCVRCRYTDALSRACLPVLKEKTPRLASICSTANGQSSALERGRVKMAKLFFLFSLTHFLRRAFFGGFFFPLPSSPFSPPRGVYSNTQTAFLHLSFSSLRDDLLCFNARWRKYVASMPPKKRLIPPLRPNVDGTGFVRAGRPSGPRRTTTPPSPRSRSGSSSGAAWAHSQSSSAEGAATAQSRGRQGRSSATQKSRPSTSETKSNTTTSAASAPSAVATQPTVAAKAGGGRPYNPADSVPPEKKLEAASGGAKEAAPRSHGTVLQPRPPFHECEIGVDAALGPSECLLSYLTLHQFGLLSGSLVQLSTSYGDVVAEARQMRGAAASDKVYVNDDAAAILVEKRVRVSPVTVDASHSLPVLKLVTLRPVAPEDPNGAATVGTTCSSSSTPHEPCASASLASSLDWQAMFRRALHHKIVYACLRTTQRVLTQRLTLEVVELTTTDDVSTVFKASAKSAAPRWGVVTDATVLHLESGSTASVAIDTCSADTKKATGAVAALPEMVCALVVGDSGTGKSRWLKQFSAGQLSPQDVPPFLQGAHGAGGSRRVEWVRVEELPQGEGSEVSTATVLRETFERARQSAPSVVLVDDLQLICARETSSAGSRWAMSLIAHALAEEVLDLQQHRRDVWVIASAPSLDSLDGCLTGSSVFGQCVVPLAMPAGPAERLECLRTCLADVGGAATLQSVSEECLKAVAQRAHGFTQRDLHRLAETAVVTAFHARQSVVPQDADVRAAAAVVHPSSLKRFEVSVPNVSWADIGGSVEAKQTLCDVVAWCLGRQSWVFTEFNLTPPKGVLLYGPPGCSKTMLAKALANESHMNFISVKGPEVFSKWVGDSEKAVRDIFERARAASPCVVFIDELDGMCGHRGRGGVSDRVISQFLTELDGLPAAFEEKKNALVFVAATNRPDSIDGAVLRPGRIDRRVYVGLPSYAERIAITEIQFRHIPVAAQLTATYVAERTEGYTGAEVVAVVKEAAFHAITADAKAACVAIADVDAALLKVRPRIQAKDVEWYKNWPHNTPAVVGL